MDDGDQHGGTLAVLALEPAELSGDCFARVDWRRVLTPRREPRRPRLRGPD